MKLISFDQSTHITGYSVWEDGQLVTYGTLQSDHPDVIARMKDMHARLELFIDTQHPDYVTIEGTQCQHGNYKVFGVLCQMQGVLFAILYDRDIDFTVIPPMSWKTYHGIKNGKRAAQKAAAIQIVRNMDINASEDESEAILQGLYALHLREKEIN